MNYKVGHEKQFCGDAIQYYRTKPPPINMSGGFFALISHPLAIFVSQRENLVFPTWHEADSPSVSFGPENLSGPKISSCQCSLQYRRRLDSSSAWWGVCVHGLRLPYRPAEKQLLYAGPFGNTAHSHPPCGIITGHNHLSRSHFSGLWVGASGTCLMTS